MDNSIPIHCSLCSHGNTKSENYCAVASEPMVGVSRYGLSRCLAFCYL